MKTIFKVGMKVYDQVNFPDMEGIVKEITIDSKYPIEVSFNDEEYTGLYFLDGTEACSFKPTLSTKPYKVELQGFEQKALAPEFDEALEWLDNNKNYQTVFEDERTYPSKEIYEAFEALRKLMILRDYYNEGWLPDFDYNTKECKFCIVVYGNILNKDTTFSVSRVLSFKTEGIRDKFFEEQKELLEIAKPLL